MKSTLMFRQIANPRRTTLAHLTEATGPVGAAETRAEQAGEAVEETGAASRPLPQRTANPRRTVLNELPKAPIAP
jgi:hypothetical protein